MQIRILAIFASAALGACTPAGVIVGTGATAGVAASQERGLQGAFDDTVIRAEINRLWLEKSTNLFLDVGLEVHEGRVMLTGAVKNPETRVDAVRLAWQPAGVQEVINEIQVTDQGGLIDLGRDLWIAGELRRKIMFDREIRSINYSIDTVNGVVYLMGVARNAEELDRVIAYGRDISYVKRVVSHVRIQAPPSQSSAR